MSNNMWSVEVFVYFSGWSSYVREVLLLRQSMGLEASVGDLFMSVGDLIRSAWALLGP